MMKVLFLFISLGLFLNAEGLVKEYPGLFASVVNVVKNDVLNVRENTHYTSKKIAEIPSSYDFPLTFGVEKCKKIKSSTWCRVYPIAQNWTKNFSGDVSGWVNAHYLEFSNSGYVIVNGQKNCDYVLHCNNGKCEVVYDFIVGDKGHVKELKTKWIERKYLNGESNFGVTPDNVDGYCNNSMYIEDYFVSEKLEKDNR